MPNFHLWNGDWSLGWDHFFLDFRKISSFPKILSRKSFSNSRGNLDIQLLETKLGNYAKRQKRARDFLRDSRIFFLI